ncbi:MAG TPA: TolC family protein [Chthonomonadaceae bacterium]|nr:TolC family protein [Chthonomonadaceae bacterium]
MSANRVALLLVCLFAAVSAPWCGAQQPVAPSAPGAPRRAAAAPLPALPDPLTVDDAARIGVARNPQTIAAAAGVASAEANYKSLNVLSNPTLGISHAQGTSTAPTLNGQGADTFFDLGEVFDTSGQRRFQAAGARAQFGSQRYQLAESMLTLEQQIRDAYWSLAAAQALTRYAKESLDEAQRVNALIHTQQEAGAAPQVDVIRSGIDVANAQQAFVTAQGAERSALIALNTLLVRPADAPIHLASDILAGMESAAPVPTAADVAALTKSAVAQRPLARSAAELVRVAEYATKQTKAGRFPDLGVDYERSLQQDADTVLLSVRFPLIDFGSLRYSVRAADETRKQAVAQKEQAEQQVAQQVAQAVLDLTQGQKLLVSYAADILNPSLKLRDMAQLGYKQGATGILPVIDAETTLRSARTGYINSILAVRKAQDELAAAVGGPFPR